MGLGDLSLHVKQFMRASAQAIGQKEGICRASLTNRRNNRGRMQEGCRNRVNDSHANGEQAGERARALSGARSHKIQRDESARNVMTTMRARR